MTCSHICNGEPHIRRIIRSEPHEYCKKLLLVWLFHSLWLPEVSVNEWDSKYTYSTSSQRGIRWNRALSASKHNLHDGMSPRLNCSPLSLLYCQIPSGLLPQIHSNLSGRLSDNFPLLLQIQHLVTVLTAENYNGWMGDSGNTTSWHWDATVTEQRARWQPSLAQKPRSRDARYG